jgi:hypothetical protein
MQIQFSAVESNLIRSARRRAASALAVLRTSSDPTLEAACERSAAAVQQYCDELMDELVAAASSSSSSEAARVKDCYTEVALGFAKSVRDLEKDAERRHAIAQAVQYKILESERRLRSLLEALTEPT